MSTTIVTLPVRADALPAGYCFPNAQWQEMVATLHVDVTIVDGTIYSATAPAPEYRALNWFKTGDSTNILNQRTYHWDGGFWISRYQGLPAATTAFMSIPFSGSVAEALVLEGGEDLGQNADGSYICTDRTGPFWEPDTALVGRIPCGVGQAYTSTAAHPSDAYTVVLNTAAGASEAFLTKAMLPTGLLGGLAGYQVPVYAGTGGTVDFKEGTSLKYVQAPSEACEGLAHSSMPPIVGRTYLKRTARCYYRI